MCCNMGAKIQKKNRKRAFRLVLIRVHCRFSKYVQVHHMTETDAGVYNCKARNAGGEATGSSEVEVLPRAPGSHRHRRKEPQQPAFIEVWTTAPY